MLSPRGPQSVAFLLPCILALVPGCGGGSTASLSGTVFYDGQEVERGYIALQSPDGTTSSAGAPIANGKYKMTGLVPGPRIVHITIETPGGTDPEKKRGDRDAKMADSMKAMREHARKNPGKPFVQETEAGNNETLDLQPGSQTKDFRLEPPKKKR